MNSKQNLRSNDVKISENLNLCVFRSVFRTTPANIYDKTFL